MTAGDANNKSESYQSALAQITKLENALQKVFVSITIGKHHCLLNDNNKAEKTTKTNLAGVQLLLCQSLNCEAKSTLMCQPTILTSHQKINSATSHFCTLFGENKEKVECYTVLDKGSTIV